jgi:cyanophycinase-like exopeptidase
MNKIPFSFFVSLVLATSTTYIAQNFVAYQTGNPSDTVVQALGGVCLMGGATEDDNAMCWFLQRANGGDVLVLRTSGSNGYNSYLYSQLGVPVNSVETIVCNNAAASNEAYLLQKINQAEAIWFAGGDQWTYVSFWRNTPVEVAINEAIHQRNIVVGGTSAGMAIQGKYYFSAQNGTVTSSAALGNPFNPQMTVDSTHFIENTTLSHVITDTHFDNPNRKGRLVAFLARIHHDYGQFAKAIACDEYTAVCIDTNGIARVFGGYPAYDDNAYFIQSNCEIPNPQPENCANASPLTWNAGGQALKVYQIKGNATGNNTFDLNDWQTGAGGDWFQWSALQGVFLEDVSDEIACDLALLAPKDEAFFQIYPNPTHHAIHHNFPDGSYVFLRSFNGKLVWEGDVHGPIATENFPPGIYGIQVLWEERQFRALVVIE